MSKSPDKRLFLVGAILFGLAAIAVFTVDGPAARIEFSDVPGDLRRIVQLSEVFAHGTGVMMILLAVLVLDPERRLTVPRIAIVTFMPGIFTRFGKMLVARERPAVFDLTGSAVDSFNGFPGHSGAWDLQSFPSGHTATAVGLALALSWVYPQGRRLFFGFAVLAASQRVLFDAHFVSDTLAGAGIACFVTACVRHQLLWDVRATADAS